MGIQSLLRGVATGLSPTHHLQEVDRVISQKEDERLVMSYHRTYSETAHAAWGTCPAPLPIYAKDRLKPWTCNPPQTLRIWDRQGMPKSRKFCENTTYLLPDSVEELVIFVVNATVEACSAAAVTELVLTIT